MPIPMSRKVNIKTGAIVPTAVQSIQNCLLISNDSTKFVDHQLKEYDSYNDVKAEWQGAPEANFAKAYFESYANSLKKPAKLLIGENYSLDGVPASVTSTFFEEDEEDDLVQKLDEISNLPPAPSTVESIEFDTTDLVDTIQALNEPRSSYVMGEAIENTQTSIDETVRQLQQIDSGDFSIVFKVDDDYHTATAANINLATRDNMEAILNTIADAINLAIEGEMALGQDYKVNMSYVPMEDRYFFQIETVEKGDEYNITGVFSTTPNEGIANIMNFNDDTYYAAGITNPEADIKITFKKSSGEEAYALVNDLNFTNVDQLDQIITDIKDALNDAIENAQGLGQDFQIEMEAIDGEDENKTFRVQTVNSGATYNIIDISSEYLPHMSSLAQLLKLTPFDNAAYIPGTDSPKPDFTINFNVKTDDSWEQTPATAENLDFRNHGDTLQEKLDYLSEEINNAIRTTENLGTFYRVLIQKVELDNNRFSIGVKTENETNLLVINSITSTIPVDDEESQLSMVLKLDSRNQIPPVIVNGKDALTLSGVLDKYAEDRDDWWSISTAESVYGTNMEIANWVTDRNEESRFIFIAHDMNGDAKTTEQNPNTFGYQMYNNQTRGVCVVFGDEKLAGFVAGVAGSIDYEGNNRFVFSGRRNSSLAITANSESEAKCLESNHYNYYCSYSATMKRYECFETGEVNYFIDGNNIRWLDSAFNQIWLLREFQLALMNLLTSNKAIPFNNRGLTMITNALDKPINKALTNGVIVSGVEMDDEQKEIVNTMVGKDVSDNLYNYGYYLYLKPATSQERYDRRLDGSIFFYTDGGSIQRMSLTNNVIL